MRRTKKQTRKITLFLFLLSVVVLLSACDGRSVVLMESDESYENIKDTGTKPWAFDIEEATLENPNYRMAVWTGDYMQLVLMTLQPGEEIDLELHSGHDQFIRIEEGNARVLMGKDSDNLTFDEQVADDWAVMIPAGYWHQVINTGVGELKLYTLYAPAEHKKGTVHETYDEAKEHEHDH